MKIDQRVQEIWSGHESVTGGLTDTRRLTDEGITIIPPSASRHVDVDKEVKVTSMYVYLHVSLNVASTC